MERERERNWAKSKKKCELNAPSLLKLLFESRNVRKSISLLPFGRRGRSGSLKWLTRKKKKRKKKETIKIFDRSIGYKEK